MLFPIDVTEGGIVNCTKDEHPEKALFSIDFNDDWPSNTIHFNDSQLKNDDKPKDSTDDGIVIFFIETQSLNVDSPIFTSEEGTVISSIKKALKMLSSSNDFLLLILRNELKKYL